MSAVASSVIQLQNLKNGVYSTNCITTNRDDFDKLIQALSQNDSRIHTIDLMSKGLGAQDGEKLIGALRNNTMVQKLEIDGTEYYSCLCWRTDLDQSLIEALEENETAATNSPITFQRQLSLSKTDKGQSEYDTILSTVKTSSPTSVSTSAFK